MKKLLFMGLMIALCVALQGQKITQLNEATSADDNSLMFVRQGATGNVLKKITKANLLKDHSSYAWIDSANYYTKEYNILDYGAVSGDEISDAPAIQAAINAAYATITDMGWLFPISSYAGKVIIPPGDWYIDVADTVKSFVEIDIAKGALFTFPTNYEGKMWVNIAGYAKDVIWSDVTTRKGSLRGAYVHGGTYDMDSTATLIELIAPNVWQYVSGNTFSDMIVTTPKYGIYLRRDTCTVIHNGTLYPGNDGWNTANNFRNFFFNQPEIGIWVGEDCGTNRFEGLDFEVGEDTMIVNYGDYNMFVNGWMGDYSYGGLGAYIDTISDGNYFNLSYMTYKDEGNNNTIISPRDNNNNNETSPALTIARKHGTVATAPELVFKRANDGTPDMNVTNAMYLGDILFQGRYDGSYYNGAKIIASLSDVPSATSMPTALEFLLSESGSTTPVSKLKLFSNGLVAIDSSIYPSTTNMANLGISGKAFKNIYIGAGGKFDFNGADVLLTASTNTLTLTGGNLAQGANSFEIFTPAATGEVVDATGITAAMFSRVLTYDEAAATDISANPQIANGTTGQILMIVGSSDTNTLKLDDGNGLNLAGGASITLGVNDNIVLIYTNNDWNEVSRADN